MHFETYLWLVLMVVLFVFEGSTVGLHAIWFAIGAMLAAVCSVIGVPVIAQFVVFLLVSIALLLLLRPAAKKLLSSHKTAATNADRVFERVCVVTEEIDNIAGSGAVYVDGKTWTARSYTGEPIAADSHVTVNMIDGVKLIVSPIPQESHI